ncbi:MAG: sigma 54-interacting transcriptional regulator [Deltaproteobacteria bacterium]|nr:sigma 54-interacting transcriptional regulator [Deltaproteobacteria bacterium]
MLEEPCPRVEHLATILDSVADGVFTVDCEMRVTSFNRAAEEITGFPRREALGQPCCEIFRTAVCFTQCPVREAIETGRSVPPREIDILDRSNREVPISVSAAALRDDTGALLGGVETFRDLSQVHALKREVEGKHSFRELVSRSPAMRRLFDVIPEVAASEATVLLQGESGTGKELFARALHDLSPRGRGPLVVVNCGALPESLLEVELFGAKRGAYTGAVEDRVGRLDRAKGGTLFLDEIGDLPLPLQVKLLRVLENREFQPLGSGKTRVADVRFLAATHRDLDAMVRAGTFRQDLFFRVNVVPLSIPPLRDRPEDVPLLLDMALDRFSRVSAKRIRGFSPGALRLLLAHPYPGNVRELLNLVERAVILCRGPEIRPEHLPPSVSERGSAALQGPARNVPAGPEAVADALARHGGNRTRAARDLGVNRTTLWRWEKQRQAVKL